MATIHLVRHGQASFGAANYDQLSELGVQQCFLLGQWMRDTQQAVEHIVLGEMQRHRQSAKAFWEGYGTPDDLAPAHWRIEATLNEFDHEQVFRVSHPEFTESGTLMEFLARQDQPRAVFERMFGKSLVRWMAGANDIEYVESWSAFKERIGAAIDLFKSDEFHARHPKNTVVFTSGGPISVLCQQMMAIPDSHILTLLSVMLNSSVSKLIKSDGQLRLASINSIAHLEYKADKSLISYR
jgi:broad specificity phosphatase PhoE